MASPQNDFIVSLEETNKAPQSIQPLAVVTQHDIAENSSLSNNAAPGAESPPSFQNLDYTSQTILFVRWKTTIMRLTISEGYEYFYFNNTTKDWTTSTVPLTKIMTTVRTCMVYL